MLTWNNRIAALNDAVNFLRLQESEADEPGDAGAREQLAQRLHEEAERLKKQRDRENGWAEKKATHKAAIEARRAALRSTMGRIGANRKRDIDIARRVLAGETFSAVGKKYEISQERARQACYKVLRTCRQARFGEDAPGFNPFVGTLAEHRAQASLWGPRISALAAALGVE